VEIHKSDAELWSNVFGAEPDSWGWSTIKFLEGDWETPGVAEVTFFDPVFPDEDTTTKTLTVTDLWNALRECERQGLVDTCTGAPIHFRCDWDACSSDLLLQIAVLGEEVYA
jgi:hypothetical protein